MYHLLTVCALSVFAISAATAKEEQISCGTTSITCINKKTGEAQIPIVGNCHYRFPDHCKLDSSIESYGHQCTKANKGSCDGECIAIDNAGGDC